MATWTIHSIEHDGSKLTAIRWMVSDTAGIHGGATSGVYKIPPGHPSDKIPVRTITDAQCVAWVLSGLGEKRGTYERKAAKAARLKALPRDNIVVKQRMRPR